MDPPLLGGPSGGRRVAEVEGVAGGELRGGGGFGDKVIWWRRWLPIKIK